MDHRRSRLVKFARTPLYFTNVETWLRKLTKAQPADSLIARVPPKHIDYEKPSLRRTEIDGIKYSLDISDLVAWHLYWGFADASRLKLYSMIGEGDTVIDVGANLGEVALRSASIAGPSGRVFAFEPFPANYSNLAANVQLNDFENLTIINKGIGAERAQVEMVGVENNAGMNRIAYASEAASSNEIVEIITLDEFVSDEELTRVDLIKIDVEGYEMNVLSGGAKIIERFRPRLFIEIIDEYLKRQGSSAFEVFRFLESLEYTLSLAHSGEIIHSAHMPALYQYDIVAMPS